MMEFWRNIDFANPKAFLLLVIPALLVLWYGWRSQKLYPELRLSSLLGINTARFSFKVGLKNFLFLFRIIAFCLFILALARPQTSLKESNITTEGIDIVLAMDVSGSMLARDFEPNRLEAAKDVAADFIDGRPNDRIGLVVFAGESFTQCPITTDHSVLKQQLSEVRDGLIEDGTAIGMGLATAVNRLKDSEAKSKVVILLTDGVNNAGFVDPVTAAEAAIQFGVRVYTIGVGTLGEAPYPFQVGNQTVYRNVKVQIDEGLLKEIAKETDARYFRATDNQSLMQVYEEIDAMEKSRIEVAAVQRTSEEFLPFLLIGAVLLLLEWLMRYTILRSIP